MTTNLFMVIMDEEEKEVIQSSLEGLKKLKKTPDMEALQRIPVGKCVSMTTDLGNGKVEEVVVCRKNEETWDIAGPEIKTKMKTFDLEVENQSNDDVSEDDDAF